MRNVLIVLLAAMLPAASPVYGQATGSGKIFCWKNKAGKTECGDSIPKESSDAAVRELNKRGVTVKQTDAALTPEQKQAQQAELERKKADDIKREETRRRDKALMDTFSNEKEIDLKRNRDVQLVESNIETLQGNIKNMNERIAIARARIDQSTKDKRPVPVQAQDDFDRATAEKTKTENLIAQKRKDITALHQQYDDLKKRFAELTAGRDGQKKAAAVSEKK
jgi:hypothetical protein